MNHLAILGAGGHGKVVADCAEMSGWETVSFFDDEWPKKTTNGAWSVIGNTEILLNDLSLYDGVIVAIGNNGTRLKKQDELIENNANIVSVIHPSAIISQYSHLGYGCVLMAGTIINAGAKIGEGCIVNTAATIDHDCILGNGVHLSPGVHLAGGVNLDVCAWVGTGASISPQIEIGKNTIIGAGSVVIDHVSSNCKVVGNPAKKLD